MSQLGMHALVMLVGIMLCSWLSFRDGGRATYTIVYMYSSIVAQFDDRGLVADLSESEPWALKTLLATEESGTSGCSAYFVGCCSFFSAAL